MNAHNSSPCGGKARGCATAEPESKGMTTPHVRQKRYCNSLPMKAVVVVAALAGLGCVAPSDAGQWSRPPLGQTGVVVNITPTTLNETTHYEWKTQQCTDLDYTDVPPRAFRLSAAGKPCQSAHRFCSHAPESQRPADSAENVRIIAPSGAWPGNWASTASSMNAARWTHNCTQPVILSQNRTFQKPQDYTGPLWIATTYRFFPNGSQQALVLALSHLEFHGELQAKSTGFCPSGQLDKCWDATIIQALSTDDGLTFVPPQAVPERLAMANSFRYVPDAGRQGMGMQTNLISPGDGYIYMLVLSTVVQLPPDRSGMCIFRTPDPANGTAWRAWNGTQYGWSVSTIDPYQDPLSNATTMQSLQHVCAPVLDGSFRFGLNYHIETGTYVAFGVGPPLPGDNGTETMVYTWSHDALNWPFGNRGFTANNSATWGVLRSVVGIGGWSASTTQTGRWYPSFIDPASPGLNFEFLSTPSRPAPRAWRSDALTPPRLFYTRLNARNATTNPYGRDRDTVSIPLAVSIELQE